MKANELRIGNWVNLWGKYYRVQSVSSRVVMGGIEGEQRFVDLVDDPRQINGIPLTPEILEKIGKHEVDAEAGTDRYYLKKYYYAVWDGVDAVIFEMDEDDEDSYQITTCEFVHEIQNVIHALTKEELNIELK